jgi:RNA polymerase sigma-70 factor (ECF subfamily)
MKDESSAADDNALLQRLAPGDPEAVGALYDRYAAPVYHLLLAQTGDPDCAADLLQETFLALLDKGRSAARIRQPRAYLLGVAHHLASGARRRGRREVTLQETDLGTAATEAPWTTVGVQATMVVLKVWHDLTFREIGAALGISPDTAASRYRYAAEKLRRVLGDEEE